MTETTTDVVAATFEGMAAAAAQTRPGPDGLDDRYRQMRLGGEIVIYDHETRAWIQMHPDETMDINA